MENYQKESSQWPASDFAQKVEIFYYHLFFHIHWLLSHVSRVVWDFLLRRGYIDTEIDQIWASVKNFEEN